MRYIDYQFQKQMFTADLRHEEKPLYPLVEVSTMTVSDKLSFTDVYENNQDIHE